MRTLLPLIRQINNLTLLGHSDLNGIAHVGEGMAMKKTVDDDYILYIAHSDPPMAFSVVDVTDPAQPIVIHQVELPHSRMRGNSLSLSGDLLLIANQVDQPGDTPAGFDVYDVSSPKSPQKIGHFDTSGSHSRGAHYVFTNDAQLAHVSTGAANFRPATQKDDQFYMIVSLERPDQPTEVGRWWLPGQSADDDETLVRHEARHDMGFRLHNVLQFAKRPNRAYLAYIDGGIVILDISNPAEPSLVVRYDYHPPFPGFTHTVLPLFAKEMLVVTDEAELDEVAWDKRMWLMDMRVESSLVPIATLPQPSDFEVLSAGGWIGPHNVHENEVEPGAMHLENVVISTWFSGGLRLYDIRNPFQPVEIASFVPSPPRGVNGSRINDVFVDDRELIFAGDRSTGGLYVLKYDGDVPLA